MAVRSPHPLLIALVVALGLVSGGRRPAAAGTSTDDVVQVLADLTLIDGACRDAAVNFGIALRFASEKGVQPVVVMPGGARRAEFEAALRSRRARFGKEELCGEIAANYAEALPGSVTLSTASGQR